MLTNKSELRKLYAHSLTSRLQFGCMDHPLTTWMARILLMWLQHNLTSGLQSIDAHSYP